MEMSNLKKLNFSRNLCNHFIGENHTIAHRVGIGTIIMVFGVGFAKLTLLVPNDFFHFIGDAIGFLIHGIGSVPYIELISKIGKNGTE